MPNRKKSAHSPNSHRNAREHARDADQRSADAPTRYFKRRVLVASLIIIALIVVLYFLWQAVYVLLLIFAGILVAILLRSMASGVAWLTRLPMSWALAMTIVLLVGAIALLAWTTAPAISSEFEQLADQLPGSIDSLKARLSQYKWGRWIVGNMPTTQELATGSSAMRWRATGVLFNAMDLAIAVISIFFIAVYLAAEPELYTNGILHLVPQVHRERAARTLASLRYTLAWWLIGQAITMVIIGVLTAAGLWFIGVPLWFVLGLLAALFNFIPNFGPFISYVPAVLLALAIGPSTAIWVTVLYIIAQSFEGYVLTPLVQRKAVLMPPALTIAAQVLLGVLVGPLGLAVAAPLTAAAVVLVKMLYVEETLGDEIATPDDQLTRSQLPPIPR